MNRETNIDKKYMQRCIELAQCGIGLTYPNPMVGSVIVKDNRIIGEGYHIKAGQPHAEVNAINSVKNHDDLKTATLYVNLEPCAHFGRTPPCAKLIIDMQIPKVVVGCVDTFSKVAGKGIEMMKEAGIEVVTGVMDSECRWLNRRFFTFHEKKRPYIILKWAESADGFVDSLRNETNAPVWLTNHHCKRMVHKQRTEEQAVMIGTNTALLDNPQLTARLWNGNQPLRILIDRTLRVDKNSKIFDPTNKTIVFNNAINSEEGNLQRIQIDFAKNIPNEICQKLYEIGTQSVVIEGGTITLQAFIDNNLWDEAFVYKGATTLGTGVKRPIINRKATQTTIIYETQLIIYKNQ